MILTNWYKLFSNFFSKASGDTKVQYVKNIKGADVKGFNDWGPLTFGYNGGGYSYPYIGRLLQNLTNDGGVILGSGTVTPNKDDYWLSGEMITTFTYSSTVTNTKNDNGHTLTAIYTITNTSDTAITIGELGVVAQATNDYQYYSDASRILLERTVLDEPVTIPSKGVGQITYTIDLNFPIE